MVHVNRIRKVKDLKKLDLEDPRTPEEEQGANPTGAAAALLRGVTRRSSMDHWRTYLRYVPPQRKRILEFKQTLSNCHHESIDKHSEQVVKGRVSEEDADPGGTFD